MELARSQTRSGRMYRPTASATEFSGISGLPMELIEMSLRRVANIEDAVTMRDSRDAIRRISTLKLVSKLFRVISDDLLVEIENLGKKGVQSTLCFLNYEPTRRAVDVAIALSRNPRLRHLVQILRCHNDSTCAEVALGSWKDKDVEDLYSAMQRFPSLHSVDYGAYLNESAHDVTPALLMRATKSFIEHFYAACQAVSMASRFQPQTLTLRDVPFSLLLHWTVPTLRIKQIVANITVINIQIAATDDGLTSSMNKGAWRKILCAATKLRYLSIGYVSHEASDDNIAQFIQDCLEGQHWHELTDFELKALHDNDDFLLDFLRIHAETLTSLEIHVGFEGCAHNPIHSLDMVKDVAKALRHASVIYLDNDDWAFRCGPDCDCVDVWAAVLDDSMKIDDGMLDLGSYLLPGPSKYSYVMEKWVLDDGMDLWLLGD